MRHSLRAHVTYLEKTIQDLRNRLATTPKLSIEELQDIELQLALAESALAHYRQAYALELSVSGSKPPNNPSSNSDGGSPETSNPEKKKNPQAAIEARARKRARTLPVRRTPNLSSRITAARLSRARI